MDAPIRGTHAHPGATDGGPSDRDPALRKGIRSRGVLSPFLCFCHVQWRASGGSREPGSLWIGCFMHHPAVDHDLLTISCTGENPVFGNSRGEVIEDRHNPPPGR